MKLSHHVILCLTPRYEIVLCIRPRFSSPSLSILLQKTRVCYRNMKGKILMPSQVIAPLTGRQTRKLSCRTPSFLPARRSSVLTLLRVILPPGEPAYGVPFISPMTGTRVRPGGPRTTWAVWQLVSRRRACPCKRIMWRACLPEAPLLLTRCNILDTRLIALASNGRGPGGLLLFGNVAGDVFATAPTSLLLLHPAKDERLPLGPIHPVSYRPSWFPSMARSRANGPSNAPPPWRGIVVPLSC